MITDFRFYWATAFAKRRDISPLLDCLSVSGAEHLKRVRLALDPCDAVRCRTSHQGLYEPCKATSKLCPAIDNLLATVLGALETPFNVVMRPELPDAYLTNSTRT